MKSWLIFLLGCCGCLDDALPQTDVDMGQVEVDMGQDESGRTICEEADNDLKIKVLGGEPSQQVQCLEEYGGGWLLVARSGDPSMAREFGWLASTGSLDDKTYTYSLGADLRFSEILVGAGPAGQVAYQKFSEVTQIQLSSEVSTGDFGNRSVLPLTVTRLQSTCTGEGASAFTAFGQSGLIGLFWFGESLDPSAFTTGLYPDGWRLRGTSCSTNGNFDGQGAIYVRALKELP